MISRDQIAELRKHATDPDYHTATDCCIGEPENGIIEILDTLEALWKVAEAAKRFKSAEGAIATDLDFALAALEEEAPKGYCKEPDCEGH